jgi:hypothetical protein
MPRDRTIVLAKAFFLANVNGQPAVCHVRVDQRNAGQHLGKLRKILRITSAFRQEFLERLFQDLVLGFAFNG